MDDGVAADAAPGAPTPASAPHPPTLHASHVDGEEGDEGEEGEEVPTTRPKAMARTGSLLSSLCEDYFALDGTGAGVRSVATGDSDGEELAHASGQPIFLRGGSAVSVGSPRGGAGEEEEAGGEVGDVGQSVAGGGGKRWSGLRKVAPYSCCRSNLLSLHVLHRKLVLFGWV
jgi:hypothetical protein